MNYKFITTSTEFSDLKNHQHDSFSLSLSIDNDHGDFISSIISNNKSYLYFYVNLQTVKGERDCSISISKNTPRNNYYVRLFSAKDKFHPIQSIAIPEVTDLNKLKPFKLNELDSLIDKILKKYHTVMLFS